MCVDTVFLERVNLVGKRVMEMGRRWTEEEGAYWSFEPEEASQPMGLWKELARLRQQVIS